MRYFPDGLFAHTELGINEALHEQVVRWYGSHLAAMGEPSLFEPADAARHGDAVRFLWLPTEGPPTAVRIARGDGACTLVLRQLSGSGGYRPGTLVVDRARTISDDEWARVTASLDAMGFWSLPTTGDAGFDGEQWIVEGRRGGRYHLVDRWCPKLSAPAYVAACEQLVRLAEPALLPLSLRSRLAPR